MGKTTEKGTWYAAGNWSGDWRRRLFLSHALHVLDVA